MKCALFAAVLGTVVAATIGVGAASAYDNNQAALALHIAPVGPPTCTVPGLRAATLHQQVSQLSVPGVGPYYYMYLVACNASDSTKVGGIECGIQYNGVVNELGDPSAPFVVFSWTNCGTLEFTSTGWPASGGGNAITWNLASCPSGRTEPSVKHSVMAIAGYFYVGAYAPTQVFVTPRPVSGQAAVADCVARTDVISGLIPTHLGSAGFGMVGLNPCGYVTPTEPTTWSNIKSQFGK